MKYVRLIGQIFVVLIAFILSIVILLVFFVCELLGYPQRIPE